MVQVKDAGPVRYIRFDRPEKLNALRRSDLVDAREAITGAGPDTGALVFGGEGGRAVSAGMDLETFVGIVENPDTARDVIGEVRALLDAVRTCELVTIAEIDGYCLGAAFELVLACDLRIATPAARLGLPEIELGLPCILDSALLSQFVGLSRAKEIMLTGDLYGAEQLQSWGMINDLVPATELRNHVAALAERMASKSRPGVASQKRLFELWQNGPLHASNDASLDEIDRVFHEPITRTIVTRVAGERAARARG